MEPLLGHLLPGTAMADLVVQAQVTEQQLLGVQQ